MNITDWLLTDTAELAAEEAEQLQRSPVQYRFIRVNPPVHNAVPDNVAEFIGNIKEPQTKWLKLKNISPIVAYEIIRSAPDNLRFQYAVPTKRMERKVRGQLPETVNGISFDNGTGSLPVDEDDTIGGGFFTTGRADWHPLQTEFDQPPINHVAASLHQDAMRDTRFVIQILFQPNVSLSPHRLYWNRRAYKHRNYLKKEKERLWDTVQPTSRERNQSKAVDRKAGNLRFNTSIRILIINGGEYTKSRLKEVAAGFNAFENADTGQYLNIETVSSWKEDHIRRFADTIRLRTFGRWSRSFQTYQPELGGLLTVPDREQDNIATAAP